MDDIAAKPEKKIMLIDQNAYFASVEQQCNPELRGKLIAVCGEGRTIVVTSSYEARWFGVKTGMTLPEARRRCPDLIPVIGNLDKYIDTSLKIHKIFLEFTNKVEVFSIDECFLDVTETEYLFGGAVEIAKKIKKAMANETGLKCSIGIAPNKVVAKIAAKSKKPDGLVVVGRDEVKTFMATIPVEKLQGVGIGRKISQKLKYMGINTAKQLGEADLGLLKGRFGVLGGFYKNIGLGLSESSVKDYSGRIPIKSVGHSHTLPQDTYDMTVIRSYMLLLSEKTAARLREYKMKGRTVSMAVRFGDFDMYASRDTLKHYFNSGVEIYNLAMSIFDRVLPLQKPVRLIGVSITNLAGGDKQRYLFENIEKRSRLLEVMDDINKKYGDFTLRPTSLMTAEKYGILGRCGIISTRLIK
jgi:DNA polymerase-4